MKAILTDIEGTTTSISFVKDCLFPFARAQMEEFIKKHYREPHIVKTLQEVEKIAGITGFDEVLRCLHRWMDEDQKITPLKTLQGLLWEEGYRNGSLQGHIYEDAYKSLKQWKEKGISLFVFSSGSVHAQKLLFSHTAYGDLTPFFNGYFDTTVGSKKESASYTKIAAHIGFMPQDILFLSDIKEEVDAALRASMKSLLISRDSQSNRIKNFYEVHPYAGHSV